MNAATDFARAQWDSFVQSKTFKALLTIEAGALAVFVQQVASGQQPLTVPALKGWALAQAAIVVGFFVRHTLAGIEAKLDGSVDPAIVKAIESAAVDAALVKVAARSPDLAAAVRDHLNDKEPPATPSPIVRSVS